MARAARLSIDRCCSPLPTVWGRARNHLELECRPQSRRKRSVGHCWAAGQQPLLREPSDTPPGPTLHWNPKEVLDTFSQAERHRRHSLGSRTWEPRHRPTHTMRDLLQTSGHNCMRINHLDAQVAYSTHKLLLELDPLPLATGRPQSANGIGRQGWLSHDSGGRANPRRRPGQGGASTVIIHTTQSACSVPARLEKGGAGCAQASGRGCPTEEPLTPYDAPSG
jgi:hypothetical protein